MKEKGFGSSRVFGLKVSYYLLAFLLFAAGTLSGCIEEYDADISSDDTNLLVVEGAICAGAENKFYLSRTQPIKSYGYSTVTGAVVSVRGTDGSEFATQPDGDCYTCWIEKLSPDEKYYLHIECDGQVYESEPQRPLPTEKIEDIAGEQNELQGIIDVVVTPAEPFNPEQKNYYSWTYDETWEVRPYYTTDMYYDTIYFKPILTRHLFPERGWKDRMGSEVVVGASTSYEGQHIRKLKLYGIKRTDERMYYKYSALVHQRAISKAEYEYELARRQASSEMGGLFTPQPSALPTNIHCLTSDKRVIGYVGCSLNRSDYRLFLVPQDFKIYLPVHGDDRMWVDNPSDEFCLLLVRRGLFLCEWNDEREKGDALHTAWAYQSQLDVRLQGAYIEEPYYWSWNENVSF